MDVLPATAFLIRGDGGFLCPVCGWAGTFTGDHFDDEEGGRIATGICFCCLFEPGFDDNPLASSDAMPTVGESIAACRTRWLDAGAPWLSHIVPRPSGWDAERQLQRLFELAPFLRP